MFEHLKVLEGLIAEGLRFCEDTECFSWPEVQSLTKLGSLLENLL